MITIPFVLLFGLLAFGCIKWGTAKWGHIIVGTLFGLVLASTSIGGQIVAGITTLSVALIHAANSAIK